MKKMLLTLLAVAVCVCLAEVGYGSGEIAINASPSTVVLDGSDDYTITVHTDLPYDSDDLATVNGVDASTFSDDCGNLVARADIELDDDDIGDLEGLLVVDGTISGTDTITVKEDGKKPKPGTGPGPGGS